MEQTRETLKSYFETGDKPTEQEYQDLIDSCYNKLDDNLNLDLPDASTTSKGVVEQATLAEVENGSDSTRYVTPAGAKRAVETHGLVKSVNGLTGDVVINAGSTEDSGWVEPNLLNGIANVGGNFQVARYRKINNIVYVEGRVNGGDDNATNTVFRLPTGFRPTARLSFSVVRAGNRAVRLDVNPNGNVRCFNFSSNWTSICGVSFLID